MYNINDESFMLLIILVILTIFSGLALLLGSLWILVTNRKVEDRIGNEIGMQTVGEPLQANSDSPAKLDSASETKIGGRENLNFIDIKKRLKQGKWQNMWPLLSAIFGFLGLLLFGSLVVMVAMEDKLLGSLVAAVSIFTVLRVLIRMVRV